MSRASYKTRVVKAMKAMGTYRKEYDLPIGTLAGLLEQYERLNQMYMDEGMPYYDNTQAGKKKSPIVTTLESLRKDILAYETALGLTPAGAKKLDGQPADAGASPLVKALMMLESDSS